MNYICLVDNVVEYSSNSLSEFEHYQMMFAKDHKDANVQYLILNNEELDSLISFFQLATL
jgi:hypothetical protein